MVYYVYKVGFMSTVDLSIAAFHFLIEHVWVKYQAKITNAALSNYVWGLQLQRRLLT
jgi:hypothetical protein